MRLIMQVIKGDNTQDKVRAHSGRNCLSPCFYSWVEKKVREIPLCFLVLHNYGAITGKELGSIV